MTQWFWMGVGVLALWAAIVVLRRKRDAVHGDRRPKQKDDEIDYAALEEAEREVKDLETDAKGRPLDEGIGDDWGPGTPKPPYV